MTTNNNNIRDTFRAIIQEEAEKIAAEILAGLLTDSPIVTSEPSARQVGRSAAQPVASQPVPKKRGRKSGARVGYIARDLRVKGHELPSGNISRVYAFLIKAKGQPRTERQIAEALAMKTDADGTSKAAQSAIWYLRNHDSSGNRLDLTKPREAAKALVLGVAL